MRVRSTQNCGFRRDGRALLRKGDNDLAEPLSRQEQEFIDVVVNLKIAEVLPSSDVPEAPKSETKLVAAKPVEPSKKRARRKKAV